MSSKVFSSTAQLGQIAKIVVTYGSTPFCGDTIPGAVMEGVLAYVRGGQSLRTYDFVDVVNLEEKIGWQVKSTKEETPVTWKRAKIPDAEILIEASHASSQGLQALGDAIIAFCNRHALHSLNHYGLDEIGYSRLIVHATRAVTYYERVLISRQCPELFNPADFVWKWSAAKKVVKKEQLSALHGVHSKSGKKWFAWHGLGENQLHFSGEVEWWPVSDEERTHAIRFALPPVDAKMPIEVFADMLAKYKPVN
jgi:hypothetical protein